MYFPFRITPKRIIAAMIDERAPKKLIVLESGDGNPKKKGKMVRNINAPAIIKFAAMSPNP
jgi:hypothetical protein